MSIDYTLELASPPQGTELQSLFESSLGGRYSGDAWVAHDMVAIPGLPGPLERQTVREELGFEPECSVLFRFSKEANIAEARVRLIDACAAILSRTPADAALLFNGEVVIFIRRSGSLVANQRPGFWTPPMLAALGHPPREPMRAL